MPDSLNPTGYLFTINASRIPGLKVNFPVEKKSFKLSRLGASKAITYSDAGGQIFFVLIFSERKEENAFGATLAKIYKSDGLSWSMNYQLSFVPKEIAFDAGSGELAIRGGDGQKTTMDKNGVQLK